MRKAISNSSTGGKESSNDHSVDKENRTLPDDTQEETSSCKAESPRNIHPVSVVKKKAARKKTKFPLTRQEQTSSKLGESDRRRTPYCTAHNEQIKFMCLAKGCLRELCSYCIIEHPLHIHYIKTVDSVVEEALRFYQRFDLASAQETITSHQNSNLQEIDGVMTDFLTYFKNKIHILKNEIIAQDKKLLDNVSGKEYFLANAREISTRRLAIDANRLACLKNYLRSEGIQENSIIKVEVMSYLRKFGELFDESVKIERNGISIETTDPRVPKVLHWFDWSKKRLYIYDILKNCSRIIDLQINFRIPSYSRSVITPLGQIFLMGGEEPEMSTRDEVFMFDCTLPEPNDLLFLKSKMPIKKYDFTMCVLDGCIYVISGRDSTSEIVDKCEKYDYVNDKWYSIAPVIKKRYAAACASVSFVKKIYLFGGRSENNNKMLDEIEEYNAVRDCWTLVTLKEPSIWTPVEVSAMIQIEEDKVLIFGGSDSDVRDTQNSYVFNINDYSLEKTEDLKRPQVFVPSPVCYGRNIYAVGNEYHIKNRSLNRFNIDKREWSIIF